MRLWTLASEILKQIACKKSCVNVAIHLSRMSWHLALFSRLSESWHVGLLAENVNPIYSANGRQLQVRLKVRSYGPILVIFQATTKQKQGNNPSNTVANKICSECPLSGLLTSICVNRSTAIQQLWGFRTKIFTLITHLSLVVLYNCYGFFVN